MANKAPTGMKMPDTMIVYCNDIEQERYLIPRRKDERVRFVRQNCIKVQRLAEKSNMRYHIDLIVTNI